MCGSPAAFSTSFSLTIDYLRACLAMKEKKCKNHAMHNEVMLINDNSSNNNSNNDDDQDDDDKNDDDE